MHIGNSLFNARHKTGLSQEAVAEKLGVSRQTISKWETDETVPDIHQAKKLSLLYGLTLDELITFDADIQFIQESIDRVDDSLINKIDWTTVWSKKYPVLSSYPKIVDKRYYAESIDQLLARLQCDYGYSLLDAMLVLKDILARVWQTQK